MQKSVRSDLDPKDSIIVLAVGGTLLGRHSLLTEHDASSGARGVWPTMSLAATSFPGT